MQMQQEECTSGMCSVLTCCIMKPSLSSVETLQDWPVIYVQVHTRLAYVYTYTLDERDGWTDGRTDTGDGRMRICPYVNRLHPFFFFVSFCFSFCLFLYLLVHPNNQEHPRRGSFLVKSALSRALTICM